MEPTLGSSVCLICFEMTEKHIFVPSDAPEKLFINCNKYLHSTLTKGTLKDIELHNENQVPLCKRCFDCALELSQLSEQLTTIQKDISDLTVAFSMSVFHRRSQVYSIGQSCKTSSIVEFNEACLPPNLFSMKLGDLNIHTNNQEMDINGLNLQTDITNVKCEASDIQYDNLFGNPGQSFANDDVEIQFNKENLDEQCGQPISEQNQNIVSLSEIRIVHLTGRNDSKNCADPKDGVKLTMSDLLKSVKMPKIMLERVKVVGHKLDVSVGNSNQTKCLSRQKNLDEALFKDNEFSVHSFAPESLGDGNQLKCLYCEKPFAQECHRTRTLHHKTHTGDKIYKRSLGKQKFVNRSNQKVCQITPTGRKTFYKCSYCEKLCSSSYGLKIHERTHTGEKPFKCSFCNYRFKASFTLKRHEKTHTGEKPFKCSFCSARFINTTALKSHERCHSGEKPYKCSFCNKRFKESGHLKSHERIHTGEKPFKCSFCSSRFNRKSSVKCHEASHTGEEKPFKCSFCHQRFSNKANVKSHERTHTGEKPYKCSFCTTRFSHKSSLKTHEIIHTRELPFKCSFCGRSFNRKCNLKIHERLHTGEKPYKCLYCEKTFSRTTARNSHQKCHTEQMSSLVSQFGNQKDGSLEHLNHQEQMPSAVHMEFKCSFCEMSFSHDEERAKHEKIHGRENEIVNDNFIVGI